MPPTNQAETDWLADSGQVINMPAISFFADKVDVTSLLDRLNADPEIAFIIPDGPFDPEEAYGNRIRAALGGLMGRAGVSFYGNLDDGSKQRWRAVTTIGGVARLDKSGNARQRWKAVRTVEGLKDGNHALWHIPAGPLPLLTEDGQESAITDAWAGWTEQRMGADPTTPYFGAGHHAHIRLELWTRHQPYSEEEQASLPTLMSYWQGVQAYLVTSTFQWTGGHYRPPPRQTSRWWNRLKAWFARTATPLANRRETFWAFPSALRKLKGGMAYDSRGWDLSASIRTAEPER